MARFHQLILPFFLVAFVLFISRDGRAQGSGYELLPAPDIWYNDVDGIRLGVRLKGQVPGSFEDGPHRLDAGFWIGTWIPDLPVSYYLSFTEPIEAWSEYGSEAGIRLRSSIRTGYHNHGVGLSKRWQQGFDERRYREAGLYTSFEKRFDREYTAFPALWSEQNKVLTSLSFELNDSNGLGWYRVRAAGNLQYLEDTFATGTVTASQSIPVHRHWGLHLRSFTGFASDNTTPEYLFSRSMRPAVQWMNHGVTRAKGTIPQPWMESGWIHTAGGANLRGYTSQDVQSFKTRCLVAGTGGECPDEFPEPNLLRSFTSVNIEFDYWNPVAVVFNSIPYASEFLRFRSYLFFDGGTSLGIHAGDPDEVFSNAGAGFSLSLNIPDYHGKPRGFVLRYEIPFWLSHPGEEEAFKLRHLAGLGAVISF